MAYKVGEVIYVVHNEKAGVLPLRVAEAVTRETLQGTEVKYIMETPDGRRTELDDGMAAYRSPEDLTEALYQNMKARIDKIVSRALEATTKWDTPETPALPQSADDEQGASIEIELPNGQKGRLRT